MAYIGWHLAVVFAFCSACGSASDVDRVCNEIVNGQLDPTHSAVVALTDEQGELICSATLIERSGSRGVLLTAAHCLNHAPSRVAFGIDYREPSDWLPIADLFGHPDFDYRTGAFDFALVFVEGDLPNVSPIGVASAPNDGLSIGTEVRFVGFGDAEGDVPNSKRNEVSGVVDTLSSNAFEYEQSAGGPCARDSGGPALALIGEQELLVGITSFGDYGCWSRGTSGRTSAAHAFVSRALAPTASACD